jgi:hypothetical protein
MAEWPIRFRLMERSNPPAGSNTSSSDSDTDYSNFTAVTTSLEPETDSI